MKRKVKMLTSESGVSAVEFGLIAPLLFVLTFAIIEFGLLLFDKAVITNASREGARAAIVYNSDSDGTYAPLDEQEIKDVVKDYANTQSVLINLGPGSSVLVDGDITVTWSDPSGTPVAYPPNSGDDVEVEVVFIYDFLVFPDLSRLIGGGFDGNLPIEGITIMRME